jgi:glycosyltransferase involved in cell wall biosynthesis
MNIAIITANSPGYMPYLRIYTDLLDQWRISYTIFDWYRAESPGQFGQNERAFVFTAPGGNVRSWLGYVAYRRFLRKALSTTQFDAVLYFGLQTTAIVPPSFHGRPYLVDIRDYSHESNFMYRRHTSSILRDSLFVAVSSPQFKEWLPITCQPVVCHNVTADRLSSSVANAIAKEGLVLYVGAIAYYRPSLDWIKELAPDSRFSIRVAGLGPCAWELQRSCEKLGLGVSFTGYYRPDQKDGIIHPAEYLTAIYGNDSPNVRTLLPNKLYDAAILGKPLVVSAGTYLGEVVADYDLGIVYPSARGKSLGNELIDLRAKVKSGAFHDGAKRFILNVEREIEIFQMRLLAVMQNLKLA